MRYPQAKAARRSKQSGAAPTQPGILVETAMFTRR